MSETSYYQRNREVVLNRANEYYQNNEEVLREKQEINIEHYQKIKKM